MCIRDSCEGTGEAVDTLIGRVPPVGEGGINVDGLDVDEATMKTLLEVDEAGWRQQLPQMHEHFAEFGEKLPQELHNELDSLDDRLRRA